MKKAAVFGKLVKGKSNVSKKYFEHLERAGIYGELIYPSPPETAAKLYDCLIVCGGGDIHPKHYGQAPYSENALYDDVADKYELEIINAFKEQKKGILGICRGMQSINVAFGGTLIQDIPGQLGLCHKNESGDDSIHEIKISDKSNLSKVMGIRSIVNSCHHQCIHLLGKGLRVIAASHDGIIEAIDGESLPVLAVQWHPERMNGNNLFDCFSKYYL